MEGKNFEITLYINKSISEEQEVDLYSLGEFNIFKNRKINEVKIKNASSKEIYHILGEINKEYLKYIYIRSITDKELIFNFDFPNLIELIFSDVSKLFLDFNAPKLHILIVSVCDILNANKLKNKCFPHFQDMYFDKIKIADISFISNSSFPNLMKLTLGIKKMRSILSLLTQKFEKLGIVYNIYSTVTNFYDLPYKKYLPAKQKIDKLAAKKLIKLTDIYKIVYQYIDIIYTKQLIGQIKKFSNHCDDYKTYKIGKFSDI